ncbi:hypothetical protein D3C83_18630 [compost metagenome]
MREQTVGRGAVPVLRIGRDVDDVAGVQHLRLLAGKADAADARQAIERLSDRVGVPRGARAGRERDDRPAHPRRRLGDDDRVLEHDAGKGFGGAAPRLALSGANDSGFDWHWLVLLRWLRRCGRR